MRKRLAKDLPKIANNLIHGALEGNLGYLKMLIQLCGLDDKQIPKPAAPTPRGKSFEELLMDDWRGTGSTAACEPEREPADAAAN